MLINDDGLHLHQSDIETYMTCPESLRLRTIAGMNGETSNSDAAFVGTCTHAVIETELAAEEPYESLEEAQAVGAYAFLQGFEQMVKDETTYSRETFKTDTRALAALRPLVKSWYESEERDTLLQMNGDYTVEYEFDEMFTTHISGLKIFLAGRMDLVQRAKIIDWKTSGSEYRLWEKQRWAVQPTVYTWAAASNGLLVPNNYGEYVFEYKVLRRKVTSVPFETYRVVRTVDTWAWLEKITQNIASTLMLLGLENEWPLNDHSALCGPKWCPFWDKCKGAYVSGVTWK